MDSSSFSDIQQTYPDAELLPVGGSTCDCYRVKLYGKFHFMKRLKPELRTDPRYVSAMQKEFETGYRLDHPHLVRYVSKGEDYLLTEYVDGDNLKVFTEKHPDYFKSRQNADRFLSQLLDVVGYLHQHQIVHLDLKPENILITRIGHEVKLADLGYCYTDTYTDTMGRTDKYAAPEQIDGSSRVDARTDIFAIGKILQTLPCSYLYNKVIAHCTAVDPSKRYQTIEDLQKALKPSSHLMTVVIVVSLLMALLLGLFLWPNGETNDFEDRPFDIEQNLDSDSLILDSLSSHPDDESIPLPPSKNQPEIQEPISSARPENHKSDSSPKQEQLSSSEQLKADIKATVLPKFNMTLGALPDSVQPGTEQWAQAGWALEKELSNTLQELILSHQDVPMQTVAQEYTSYVQSLITLKFNRNSQKPE